MSVQQPTASTTHLSAESIDQLRALLLEERTALIERLESLGVDRTAGDALDVASGDALIARASEALTEVEAALARIDAGTYGACESCGAAIPFERLEAVPRARQCVSCQSRAASLLG